MAEEAPLSATTDRMLKSMLKSRKWGPPLQALLSWLFETTTEGEEDVETELEDLDALLPPEATEHLKRKSENWLTFFKQLERTDCGELILGRRGFKTRFRWHNHPAVARAFLPYLADSSASHVRDFSAEEGTESRGSAERAHPFPLRQNVTVYVRVPADVTREELNRLADFTRLLPGR